MSARELNVGMMQARTGNCSCGCKCAGSCKGGEQCGCNSQCCDLECLVRPNFFCGQLLTDADLSAMVEWSRKRFALTRYRDGWGIVCGLDVSCGPPLAGAGCCGDPQSGPAVYVHPGYAIDCCGNDLVVCEPIRVDLGKMCRPLEDPCDPPSVRNPEQREPGKPGGCFAIDPKELFAVQLKLRYHEDLAQGQRAMFRSGCSELGPCEYARVLERPCVHIESTQLARASNEQAEAEAWIKQFIDRRKRVISELGKLILAGVDALIAYVRRNPPFQLCYVEKTLCCLREQLPEERRTGNVDSRLFQVGILLLTDWTLRELQCPCPSCNPDDGVPLGNVVLHRTEARGKTKCEVVMIDPGSPHRRSLRKDPCRPIAAGHLDLAPYLWQPIKEVDRRLKAQGVSLVVVREPPSEIQGLDSGMLERMGNNHIYTTPSNAELIVHVFADPTGVDRVVGFLRQT